MSQQFLDEGLHHSCMPLSCHLMQPSIPFVANRLDLRSTVQESLYVHFLPLGETLDASLYSPPQSAFRE